MIQTIGVFMIILFSKTKSGNLFFTKIIDLQTIVTENKLLSYILAINLFSMAGLPPLLGFFSKFYIFNILIQNNSIFVLILLIIMSCISAYYYVRIVSALFFNKTKKSVSLIKIDYAASIILIQITLLNLIFGVICFNIIDIIQVYTQLL